MTVATEPTDDREDDDAGSGEPLGREEAGSILADLREEYASSSLDETAVFDIAPAAGLAMRCAYVPTERFDAASKNLAKIRDKGVQMTYASCDTLIAACREIVVYGPGGRMLPLMTLLGGPEDEAEPVQFDEHLCEILGFPPDTARSQRKIVIRLFKGNTQAVRRCAIDVSEWMDGVGSKVREEFAKG